MGRKKADGFGFSFGKFDPDDMDEEKLKELLGMATDQFFKGKRMIEQANTVIEEWISKQGGDAEMRRLIESLNPLLNMMMSKACSEMDAPPDRLEELISFMMKSFELGIYIGKFGTEKILAAMPADKKPEKKPAVDIPDVFKDAFKRLAQEDES